MGYHAASVASVPLLPGSCRLYTPVPILNRQLTEPDTMDGHAIAAGTSIIISIGALHSSPDIWGPDVDTFRPERFLPEEARGRHPFAYAPFALGARNCEKITKRVEVLRGGDDSSDTLCRCRHRAEPRDDGG